MGIFDRLANHLGYVRVKTKNNNESSFDQEYAASDIKKNIDFDYSNAEYDGFSFWYNNNDVYHYAIGKKNWTPITLVAFLMAGDITDGIKLLDKVVSEIMWIEKDDPRYRDWLNNNFALLNDTFNKPSLEIKEPYPFPSVKPDDFNELSFRFLDPNAISYEYKALWRRCYPKRAETFLTVGWAHSYYQKSSNVIAARQSSSKAMAQLDKWVVDWFEYRDFEVDKTNNLVYLNGFTPFFLVSEQSY